MTSPVFMPLGQRLNADTCLAFTATNPDGSAIDITSYAFALGVRTADGGTSVLSAGVVTLQDTTGILKVSAIAGVWQLTILGTDLAAALATASITVGEGEVVLAYDLVVTDAIGRKSTWLEGSFTITNGDA